MKERVKRELTLLEEKNSIKIIYACEVGSRAYGLSSEKSDYDIRFIYIHPRDWYLSIDDDKRDVVELPISENLDMNGWDLKKALKLLRKSNPSLLEWLASSIVYIENSLVIGEIKELASDFFSAIPCMYHYLNMAKRSFIDCLKDQRHSIKKLFRALRPLLICLWIEKHQSIAPIDFQLLVKEVLPEKLYNDTQKLVNKIRKGEDLARNQEVEPIYEFLDKELDRLECYLRSVTVKPQPIDTALLDAFFVKTLEQMWNK